MDGFLIKTVMKVIRETVTQGVRMATLMRQSCSTLVAQTLP
jgi:hypothetical protein